MCFGSSSPSYPAPLPTPAAQPDTIPVKPEAAATTDTSNQTTPKTATVRTTSSQTGLNIPSV